QAMDIVVPKIQRYVGHHRGKLVIDRGNNQATNAQVVSGGSRRLRSRDLHWKKRAAGENSEHFALRRRRERAAHFLSGRVASDIRVIGHGRFTQTRMTNDQAPMTNQARNSREEMTKRAT